MDSKHPTSISKKTFDYYVRIIEISKEYFGDIEVKKKDIYSFVNYLNKELFFQDSTIKKWTDALRVIFKEALNTIENLPSGKYARLLFYSFCTYIKINQKATKKFGKEKTDADYILNFDSVLDIKQKLGIKSNSINKQIIQQLNNLISCRFTINSKAEPIIFKIIKEISYDNGGVSITFTEEFLNYIKTSSLIKINDVTSQPKQYKALGLDIAVIHQYKAFTAMLKNMYSWGKSPLKQLYKQFNIKYAYCLFRNIVGRITKSHKSKVLE